MGEWKDGRVEGWKIGRVEGWKMSKTVIAAQQHRGQHFEEDQPAKPYASDLPSFHSSTLPSFHSPTLPFLPGQRSPGFSSPLVGQKAVHKQLKGVIEHDGQQDQTEIGARAKD